MFIIVLVNNLWLEWHVVLCYFLRCGKHCLLHCVPKINCCNSKQVNDFIGLCTEIFLFKYVLYDRFVDSVDWSWKNHVENKHLTFKSSWYVVTTSSWVIHGSNIEQIFDVFEVSSHGLIEHVESTLLNQLSDNFQSDLITPFIHKWHRNIINKDC